MEGMELGSEWGKCESGSGGTGYRKRVRYQTNQMGVAAMRHTATNHQPPATNPT